MKDRYMKELIKKGAKAILEFFGYKPDILVNLGLDDFKPLADNVFILPVKVTEQGGFERPRNDDEKQELGLVLSVGPQFHGSLKRGDLVLFNKYSYWNQELDECVIVRGEDIAGSYSKKEETTTIPF